MKQEILGYRIVQNTQKISSANIDKQIDIKVTFEPLSSVKIKHDIICNGNSYSSIPLPLSIISNTDDFISQIQTIILKPQNQILCKIISHQKDTVNLSQFQKIQEKIKNIFGLQLKISTQELFLILISDQINTDEEFVMIFDLISQVDFVNLLKKVYDYSPTKNLPKIYRKFNKYFSLTKSRDNKSIERLKNILKITKSCAQSQIIEEKQSEPQVKVQVKKKQSNEQKQVIFDKSQNKNNQVKQTIKQSKVEVQKIKQTVIVKKIQKAKGKKGNKDQLQQKQIQQQKIDRRSQKYQSKKKTQKSYEQSKQKQGGRRNGRNNQNNNRNNGKQGVSKDQTEGKRGGNGRQTKKTDPRIFLGINGATEYGWRERTRIRRYPEKDQQQDKAFTFVPGQEKNEQQKNGRRRNNKSQKVSKQSKQVCQTYLSTQQSKQTIKVSLPSQNKKLQRVYSIPNDGNKQMKNFKFQNKDYNIFVNKLFWVNINADNVTIQKQSKGYIRRGKIQIIGDGKGIMAEGLTINLDGISNLEDGGTPFSNPVFEEFTPDGQWFHIRDLQVYTYI